MSKKQEGYRDFVSSFLVKFEEVKKYDPYNSTRFHRAFKVVKEARYLFVDKNDYIIFARGLLEIIPKGSYHIVDKSTFSLTDVPIDQYDIVHSLDSFDLRDDQVLAVKKCLLNKRGVIQLPTATGKSAIISSTIKGILKYNPEAKILVLAPTLSTVKTINNSFIENHIDTSIFGHPDKEIKSPVTTSLVQSLIVHSEKDDHFLEPINAVFYDECLSPKSEILLADGSTARIADIYNDDSIFEVMSYNIETKEYEIKKILRKFKTPYRQKFWRVNYINPTNGKLEGVTVTPNHKIYTLRGYVPAEELTYEDSIKVDFSFARYSNNLSLATFVKVKSIVKGTGKVSDYKYNLEVEDNHNYFASKVLVSNCHHLKCETWNKLNSLLENVEYSLGFSALSINKSEIYETDIRNVSYETALIEGCSGRVLMHMDPSYYINNNIIALPIVFRVDHFVRLPQEFDETVWASLYKLGVMSTTRVVKSAKITSMFSRYGRKTLVLVSERDHAYDIGKQLVNQGVTKFGISFGAGKGYVFNSLSPDGEVIYDKVETLQVLSMLSKGEIYTVIGTQHIDEGVDLSQLDCMVLAGGGKKDRRIVQRVGRVLRKSKTGKYAYIVDFTDEGSTVLSRQSRERLKLYKNTIGVPKDHLFDGIHLEDLEETFKKLEGLI